MLVKYTQKRLKEILTVQKLILTTAEITIYYAEHLKYNKKTSIKTPTERERERERNPFRFFVSVNGAKHMKASKYSSRDKTASGE